MRILATILLLAFFSSQALSEESTDTLIAYGDPLSPQRTLRSADQRFWAQIQGDENFVVYGKGSKSCWASDTMRQPGTNPNADPRVILTADELAVWTRDPRTQKFTKRKVLANRGSGPKFARLIMQNDGNLVLYDENHGKNGHNGAKFATGMAKNKGCDY